MEYGPFRLGRWGVPVTIASLVYSVIGIFFSFWPATKGRDGDDHELVRRGVQRRATIQHVLLVGVRTQGLYGSDRRGHRPVLIWSDLFTL